MLELSFSSKFDWVFYIVSIAKTVSRKIADLILSMKFLSPEVAYFLYKTFMQLYMEYCFHMVGILLAMLDKLQKRECRTIGPTLAVSLEFFGYCRNITNLSLFSRYYFGIC